MNAEAKKQQFELALAECAAEPIHQLGSIQAHGALLVMSDGPLRTVVQASANLAAFLGLNRDSLLDDRLVDLFGETALDAIEELVRKVKTGRDTGSGRLKLVCGEREQICNAHVYKSGGSHVLELTYEDHENNDLALARLLLELQRDELKHELDGNVMPYLEALAVQVRELTGYDNVMIYRFDAGWNGEVICQSRAAHATDFLGMMFPASDIPVQARKLYTLNPVRVVVDTDASPVAVVPAWNPKTGHALDMSYSALRSLSPIHIEYLKNIGVRASMSISLMHEDKLWGLVVCHHMSPKRVSIGLRDAAVMVAHLVSRKLSELDAVANKKMLAKAIDVSQALWHAAARWPIQETIRRILPRLQEMVKATGVVVIFRGRQFAHGLTPLPSEVRSLHRHLSGMAETEYFHSDYLGEVFPSARAYPEIAAGALASPISEGSEDCVIWFRCENLRNVRWAGRYEDGFVQNDAGEFRLTPRKSFSLWQEIWRGRSAPWLPIEIGVGITTGSMITQALRGIDKNATENLSGSEVAVDAASRHRAAAREVAAAWQVSSIAVNQINQRALEKLTQQLPGVLYQYQEFPDGRMCFPYASSGIQGIFGVLPHELRNDVSAIARVIHPDDLDRVLQSIRDSKTTLGAWKCEYRVVLPGREPRWVSGVANPEALADGSILWHGFIADVTDRKKIEEAAQRLSAERDGLLQQVAERARLLNGLVDNLPFGVVLIDNDRNLSTWNQSAVKLLRGAAVDGHDENLRLDEMAAIHRVHSEPARKADEPGPPRLEQILADSRPFRFEASGPSGVPLEIQALPLPLGWTLITYADITAHKEAETVLARARIAAEEANMAKSGFLAAISHEIRTPLNAISGMAFLLFASSLDSEQSSAVRAIQVAAKNLLSLVNDVLDFSKIEAGQLEIDNHLFSLSDVLQEVRIVVVALAAAKKLQIGLQFDPASTPFRLLGDSNRLRQMLLNYLGNAVKFTERGRIDLRVYPVSGPEQTSSQQVRLRFEVHDTGIGISKENLSRLFLPFKQAESSVSRRFGGTGLGLSLVKRLADVMGGSLGVQSEPGKGSLFWLELPFECGEPLLEQEIEQARARIEQPEHPDPVKAGGASFNPDAGEIRSTRLPSAPVAHVPLLTDVKLLVVDDSRMNLDVVDRLLRREGAQVFLAGSGLQALELLERQHVDIALVDVQMPEMDGLELTRRIRHQSALKNLPLIALSAGVTLGERQTTMAAGMDYFVYKPVDPMRLITELRRQVDFFRQSGRWPAVQADSEPVPAEPMPVTPDLDATGKAPDLWPAIAGIDSASAQESMCDDPAFFRAMLKLFTDEHKNTVALVDSSLGAGDLKSAALRLHRLKGQAGALGATQLHGKAAALEAALRDNQAEFGAELSEFKSAFQLLIESAARHIYGQ